MNVLKINEVDINKVVISEQKGNKSKILYSIDDSELTKFNIRTGRMRIPWEPTERKNPSGKPVSINLNVSTFEMFDEDNKKSVRMFREFIYKLEDLFPSDLKLSSALYGKNPKYSPTVKFSIPFKDGKPDVAVFDKNGVMIDFGAITKGSICEFIIRVSHFWTSAASYGLQLVAYQIKAFNNAERVTIIDADDSDSDMD